MGEVMIGDELGVFLRAMRDRIRPADVGLPANGLRRRRVPGLRREELAQLAGVSVAYYTRLEQGQSRNASDAVLDALARALQLDSEERAHLHRLARPTRAVRKRAKPERLAPGTRQTLDALDPLPAFVVGRSLDTLGWNRAAHLLIAGHLDFTAPQRRQTRPNMARLVFLDPHMRELYRDWDTKALVTTAYLRMGTSAYPDDPALTSLIGELTVKSAEFAELWAAHRVAQCASAVHQLSHPVVGDLTLHEEVLTLSGTPEQRMIIGTTEPGSASEAAMRLLTMGEVAEAGDLDRVR